MKKDFFKYLTKTQFRTLMLACIFYTILEWSLFFTAITFGFGPYFITGVVMLLSFAIAGTLFTAYLIYRLNKASE